jgi:hypothetical protein
MGDNSNLRYRRSGLTVTCSISLYLSLWSLHAESKVRYITHLDPRTVLSSCPMLRSALSCGIDLTIIGVEDTDKKRVNNLNYFEDSPSARKILELSDFFQNSSHHSFRDDDIIVYNDGLNTLFSANQTNLASTFLRVEKSNTILFSAMRDCWTGVGGCAEPDTSIHSSFKYLTSSGWIARHKVAADFFTMWSKVLESQAEGYRNDQWALLQIHLSKGSLNPGIVVAVDHGCSIFQTSNDTNILSDFFSAPDPKSNNPYVRSDGTIYNYETNTEPFFFHFDEEESYLSEIEGGLWTARQQELESSSALATGCALLTSKYPVVSTCHINQTKSRQSAPLPASSSLFPTHVSVFHVRRDIYTERPVQRDRVRLLAGKQHTLSEYLKILQCPKVQLELRGRGGALSLARHIPLTRETVLLTAAYAETECEVWNGCRKVLKEFLNGSYPKDATHYFMGGFSNVKMYRVMNGSMYYDWPWGMDRIKLGAWDENFRLLWFHVLSHTKDIPDSVFFSGCETYTMKPNMPVPAFSSSPEASKSSDMPAPWNTPYQYELQRDSNKQFIALSAERVFKEYRHEGNMSRQIKKALYDTWLKRIDKAAFFGSMSDNGIKCHAMARQVVMNIAIDYPEHVIANWSRCFELTGAPRFLPLYYASHPPLLQSVRVECFPDNFPSAASHNFLTLKVPSSHCHASSHSSA